MQNLSGAYRPGRRAAPPAVPARCPATSNRPYPPGRSGRTDVPPPPHPIRALWRRARSGSVPDARQPPHALAPNPFRWIGPLPGTTAEREGWRRDGRRIARRIRRTRRVAHGRLLFRASAGPGSAPPPIPRSRSRRRPPVPSAADRSCGATTPIAHRTPGSGRSRPGCSAPGHPGPPARHRSRPDRSCRWAAPHPALCRVPRDCPPHPTTRSRRPPRVPWRGATARRCPWRPTANADRSTAASPPTRQADRPPAAASRRCRRPPEHAAAHRYPPLPRGYLGRPVRRPAARNPRCGVPGSRPSAESARSVPPHGTGPRFGRPPTRVRRRCCRTTPVVRPRRARRPGGAARSPEYLCGATPPTSRWPVSGRSGCYASSSTVPAAAPRSRPTTGSPW